MSHTFRFFLFVFLFQTLIISGCATPPPPPKSAMDLEYIEVQEFKLKVRELADQMLATMNNTTLTGLVAMPTSFVNINNKAQTSAFGNLLAESLIYEFNQRAFPVREYRLSGDIDIKLAQGDFALLRKGLVDTNEKWAALIVGTYYVDKDAVIVNARLVRARDGMVLRTGQLVLVKTPFITRLTQHIITTDVPKTVTVRTVSAPRNPPKYYGPAPKPVPRNALGLESGTLNIRQVPKAQSPTGPGLYGNMPYDYYRTAPYY